MATKKREIATLGGGCFWCTEAIFAALKGVDSVVSGYAGGVVPNPTYEAICTGITGHAEVIQVAFDPKKISYKELLKVFFTTHDPTTLNCQGADVGTQYRSVVYYHDETQREMAEEVIREFGAKEVWADPIVTEVAPLDVFYPAEAYHNNYYAQNSQQPYCQIVITPKIAKLRKEFKSKLK